MVNYNNGKIYKIVCNITNNTYIGSTTAKHLSQRLSVHVADYKRFISGKSKACTTSRFVLERGNYSMVLIELVPCTCQEELTAREAYYIRRTECVNQCIPQNGSFKRKIDGIKSDNFEPEHSIVKIINETLKIKEYDMDKYKDYFQDSKKLLKHLTYSAYFKKEKNDILQQFDSDIIMKFKLLDDLQEAINCTKENILDYIPNNDEIESSTADILNTRYSHQFRNRTKSKIETSKDVYEIIKRIYRNMFDFAGVIRRSHKTGRTYLLVFDADIINHHDVLIEYRTNK
jgi:hypothetical protein